jgi:DNA-binding transcriptional MerR regulator
VNQDQRTDPEPGFRVEELSARSGAPVRTIREYQTWQILHPPTRVGRVGYYDESHVRRLEGIDRLQQRGYSIAAIRDLFEAWEQGAGLRDVLGVDDAIGLPADEAPVALSAEQFDELVPAIASSARLRARAAKVGLITEDGEWIVARSPALLQLVADAIGAGLSPTGAIDLAAAVVSSADQTGRAAAEAVAAAAASGDGNVESLVRRGRVLLARAVASHTIDQVGRHLRAQAEDMPGLDALLDDIRIGTVTRVPAPGAPGDRARGGRAARP